MGTEETAKTRARWVARHARALPRKLLPIVRRVERSRGRLGPCSALAHERAYHARVRALGDTETPETEPGAAHDLRLSGSYYEPDFPGFSVAFECPRL